MITNDIQTAAAAGLVARLKNPDASVRGPAWQGAGAAGAEAIRPVAALLASPDFETVRSAKRALWKITRHAGRPGAEAGRAAVQAELILLLGEGSAAARCEALGMLSEIGDTRAVGPMAALLSGPETREEARRALMRIPGPEAPAALRGALETAPEAFRFALAESLRQRGETVPGYPSQKRVPSKPTAVGKAEGKSGG